MVGTKRRSEETEKRHNGYGFGRGSVYNTKAVCANDEFVNC